MPILKKYVALRVCLPCCSFNIIRCCCCKKLSKPTTNRMTMIQTDHTPLAHQKTPQQCRVFYRLYFLFQIRSAKIGFVSVLHSPSTKHKRVLHSPHSDRQSRS